VNQGGRAVYVLGACRTPMGRFGGAFSGLTPAALGAAAAAPLVARLRDRAAVEEVIVGQVLQAGAGMNVARQVALASGLPEAVPAYTVNKVCGSGMKAITLGASSIAGEEADLVLVGGVEVMSRAPFLLGSEARAGWKMGDLTARDSMLCDGLTDPTHQLHMARTAEALAQRMGITRAAQDAFALQSQRRWAQAQEAGAWAAELVPVSVKGGSVTEDETPRPATTAEALAGLRPAFTADGTITAGNASALADGAAALLLGSEKAVTRTGLAPLARVTAWASVGVPPMDMGLGPVAALRQLFAATGTTPDDYDLFEINEAFAAQVLACRAELPLPLDRLNLRGGSIALGHPLGCTGARLVVSLLHSLTAHRAARGLASLCIGGGMGMALAAEMT